MRKDNRWSKDRWMIHGDSVLKMGRKRSIVLIKCDKIPDELPLLSKMLVKLKTWFITATGRGVIYIFPPEYTQQLLDAYIKEMKCVNKS
jgi:hypothetical protein